jgi:hypothetical protein
MIRHTITYLCDRYHDKSTAIGDGGGDSGGGSGFDFSSGMGDTSGLSGGGDASAGGNIEGMPLTNVGGDSSGSGITAQGTGMASGIDPSSFSGAPSDSFNSAGSGVSQTGALGSSSTLASGVPSSFGGSSGAVPTNSFGLDASNFSGGSGVVDATSNAFNSSSNPALTFGTGLTTSTDPSQSGTGPTVMNTAQTAMGAGGLGASSAAPSFAPPSGVTPADISTIDPTSNAAMSSPGTSGLPVFGANGALQGNLTSSQGQPPQQPGASQTDAQGNPINMSPQTGAGQAPGAPATGASGTSPTTPSSGLDFSQLNTPIIGNITGQQPQTGTGSSMVNSGTGSGNNQSSSSGLNLGSAGGIAGALTAGAGLASSLLNKNNVPGQSEVSAINSTIPQLQGLISNVQQTATQLQNSTGPLSADTLQMLSYVNSGQLPPNIQAQVDQGVQSAKAAAASAMAAKGLPADPTNNPQLASQYATIDSQALSLSGQLENQLYQSGLQAWQTANSTQQVAGQLENNAIQATGIDLQTYMALQSIYQNQSNQEQAAIGNLASALGKMGGGSNTLTIKTT